MLDLERNLSESAGIPLDGDLKAEEGTAGHEHEHGCHHPRHRHGGVRRLIGLSIGSIGVVYGDIGTSPLYAFRQALLPLTHDGVITPGEVIGPISLIIWTLTIIVMFKYILFLLRLDNEGEGGTLSLLALLLKTANGRTVFLTFLGLIGAALFLGEVMITPAVSVLSAVEGLKLVANGMDTFILPIAIGILIGLFAVQSSGTGAVAKFFGPVTLVWFVVIGLGGLSHILDNPAIFQALNPWNAVNFVLHEGYLGFVVLGAVFLTVTGTEALYADLGHFGRKPIQLAFVCVVYPSLMLNYLGQGAFVLSDPSGASDPFFLMFPKWALLPVVILATAATIIASQAVITGAFSLTRQAIHLGFLPRMEILFTSETNTGQIYLPAVNRLLLAAVIILVLSFRTSESLATAYGISVTGAMVVTTTMSFAFIRARWKWPLATAVAVLGSLLMLECIFFSANLLKIHDGGYIPVMFAIIFTVVMWTWRRGTQILFNKTRHTNIPLMAFISSIEKENAHAPKSVPGTAIFLTSDSDSAPAALMHNLKHNHVLHDKNVFLTIRTVNKPRTNPEDRYQIEKLSDRFSRVQLSFGYMEAQNISRALIPLRKGGMKFDIMSTSFYLGRYKEYRDPKSEMPKWQGRLYVALANMAAHPSDYFNLPSNRVVELTTHIAV
ncbi:potassium transporter Kup [Rhizobium ruizarguesonis]